MDYESIVLKILNKYEEISKGIENLATESYIFDVVELDPEIIPDNFMKILTNYEKVETHVYEYKTLTVYFIEPYGNTKEDKILIGLLKEDRLVEYVIITK